MKFAMRTIMRRICLSGVALGAFNTPAAWADSVKCDGRPLSGIPGLARAWKLPDGGIAGYAKMNVNIDGYARAYHPANAAAGALIHLCNAARVYLPGAAPYEGSVDNATCTGRFITDMTRIQAAGWTNPAVGVLEWYGVLGKGSVKINSKTPAGQPTTVTVTGVEPVQQSDGSGFYVSPTALFDRNVKDAAVQSRYVNPLRVPSAVMPKALAAQGVAMGSFGVAYHRDKRIAVPFVVGDGGPRVGEGSVALVRLVSGLPITEQVTRQNRYAGQVDTPDVLWIFFGDKALPFDSQRDSATVNAAQAAFEHWGGQARLAGCVSAVPRRQAEE